MLELYDNLMVLTNDTENTFFYKDITSPWGTKFRVFSYHFASYSDWLLDDALECRGIMYEMDEHGPVRIASRPMEKFFNLNETPFTMGLDYNDVELVMAKEDGSLISSYIDKGFLGMKSKTSIDSVQACEALQVLRMTENKALHDYVKEMTAEGYTFNFEYVSPTNRIVLAYQTKGLVLLNVRCNDTGEYVPYSELFKIAELRPYLVQSYDIDTDSDEFIQTIRGMEGIEGFIFVMKGGLKFKLKTAWYSALHHTKDSINNNERLYESIVAGASDDLKAMFDGDEFAVTKINAFEAIHRKHLTESIEAITTLYEEIKGKDRKDYAVMAQTRLKATPGLFGVIMNFYEKGIDYDSLVPRIDKVFMYNVKSHIPAEYKEEKIIFGE